MTVQDYINMLENAIEKQTFHRDYDRTVKLAKDYRSIMTGKGQKEWILSYRSRETAEQKKQRLDVTVSRTEEQANRFITLTDKVARVDNVVDNVYYEDEIESKESRIFSISEKFYRGMTLLEYLHEVNQYYTFYDPNAWLMVTFKKIGDKNVPYPVEFPSEECMIWDDDGININWFIARQPRLDVNVGNFIYTLLAPNIAITYTQLVDKEIADNVVKLESGNFAVNISYTESKITPVIPVGYLKDSETQRRTYVNLLHPAMSIFKRLINDGSEYDLSKALHGFLKMYQYAEECENTIFDEEENIHIKCSDGYHYINDKKHQCGVCKGSGLVVHTTPQDVILVRKVDGKDEHIPLSEMIHYAQIPTEIIELQRRDIDRSIEEIQIAILNTQLIERSTTQRNVTATELNLDTDNINSVLYRHHSNLARLYKYCLMQCAIYTGSDKGLIINYQPPKDYQLESLYDLIEMRKKALDSGVPYSIIENIDTKILTKQSQGDQINVTWVRAWEQFRPFREMSITERINIVTELENTNIKKVLYMYFEDVRILVESKNQNFYEITDKEQQQRLIQDAVNEIIEKYNITNTTTEEVIFDA